MIPGCESGGADMVWRDTVESVVSAFENQRMTAARFAGLSQFLAIEADETASPVRVRVARRPRGVTLNMSALMYPAGVRQALRRGEQMQRDLMELYERGTAEDFAADDWLRGARVRADVLKGRALARVEWESGLGFRLMLFKAGSMGGSDQ